MLQRKEKSDEEHEEDEKEKHKQNSLYIHFYSLSDEYPVYPSTKSNLNL